MDQRGLVGGLVVHDEMHILIGRHIGLDLIEEAAELCDAMMASKAAVDHMSGRDVESSEQRRGAARLQSSKLSTDPVFVAKVRDVVGLYVSPPQHAIVLCVDEKSQIQALDRT